ncbi:hypothetical protein P5763_07375 [Bacillus cereus]|nr:hypothetical protein [Bacillus cereus]MDF9611893.1 hypothetical protein [Bacillus cereus]
MKEKSEEYLKGFIDGLCFTVGHYEDMTPERARLMLISILKEKKEATK